MTRYVLNLRSFKNFASLTFFQHVMGSVAKNLIKAIVDVEDSSLRSK
jgi:hypothetical protein